MLIHLLIVLLLAVASTTKTSWGAQRGPRLRRHFATSLCPCHQFSRPPSGLPVGPWSTPILSIHRAPSLECRSISLLVNSTRPKICVHSETMFPTTCPHLASESIEA